jgi:hypothetical protein
MNYVAQNIEDDEVMLGFGPGEPLLCAPRCSAGRIDAFAFVALVNLYGARGSSLTMLVLANCQLALHRDPLELFAWMFDPILRQSISRQ